MLMLDGRAQRSLKTCKDLLTELLAKFEKISLESKPPSPDKESRIAFRLDIQAKATQLKNMGKQAKDVVKRMEKSPEGAERSDRLCRWCSVNRCLAWPAWQ